MFRSISDNINVDYIQFHLEYVNLSSYPQTKADSCVLCSNLLGYRFLSLAVLFFRKLSNTPSNHK